MSIDVSISGLNTEVDVTRESSANVDPSVLLALRGEKGDKGDTGAAGRDGIDGTNGVGISSITFNNDYTVTIGLEDGTSYTSGNIRGQAGQDGVGISSIVFNNDYTMTVTLTDGTSTTSNSLRGATGATGNGIASIAKTGTVGLVDTYTVTYTDGDTETFTVTNGQDGNAATISVGTVTTGAAGSSATVTNSGTSQAAVFDFTIPKGDKGDTGATGSAATVSVGTVTTGAAGSSASVVNSGTSQAAVLDFTIPRGDTGDLGTLSGTDPITYSSNTIGFDNTNTDYQSGSQVSSAINSAISGKQDTLSSGDGIDITSNVVSNTQGIEYIVGTQTAATNAWTGVSKDTTLKTGKIIAYKLPYAGNSTAATLTLTMADGTQTAAIALRRTGSSTVTTHFAVNNVVVLVYDGTYWRVSAYYDSNTTYSEMTTAEYKAGTSSLKRLISPQTLKAAILYHETGEPNVQSDWNVTSTSSDAYIANKPTLATVATSGSYNDLTDTPTIPTVNDATLTIQKNGANVQTFTANASSNVTANITVPTAVSELTNDSRYIKASDSQSGNIVTIKDMSVVKSCEVDIEAVQSGSGTPSPDNVRPISGWTEAKVYRTGFNQWDEETADGYWTATGANSNSAYMRCKNLIQVIPNQIYYFCKPSSVSTIYLQGYDSDKANGRSLSLVNYMLTVPSDVHYIGFAVPKSEYGNTYNNDICINFSSDRNGEYEAYNGNTYTIDLDGTRYGGTLDVTTGTLTVTHGMKTYVGADSEGWAIEQSDNFFANVISDAKRTILVQCSALPSVCPSYVANTQNVWISGSGRINATIPSITHTVDEIKSVLSTLNSNGTPLQIVYELATPTTYTLTAQQIALLTGTNYVWADCGDISVECAGSPASEWLVNMFYPVGSYYETSDTTFDPNASWGGTWVLEAEGQVHISAGANYTISNQYGRNEAELKACIGACNNDIATLGYITHAATTYQNNNGASYVVVGSNTSFSNWNHSTPVVEASVNSASTSMMQLSTAVNRWHRTA